MKKTTDEPMKQLAELVTQHQDALFRYALFRTGSRADAEDIVQEAFLKFAAAHTERIADPKAYLFRMVANGWSCDALRRPQLQPIDRTLAVPEEERELHEEYERIGRLLSQLPPEQAEVIRLKTTGALRFAEIAELLNCPAATVKSRFRYGIGRLRKLLNL